MAQLRLKQLASDGATTGQLMQFDGTNWVPVAQHGEKSITAEDPTASENLKIFLTKPSPSLR